MSVVTLMFMLCAVPPGAADEVPPPAAPDTDAPKEEKDRRTPTPDDPQDIPLPEGYAPASPQPFLRAPGLFVVQYVAGLGARGLLSWLLFVPVVGLCAAVVSPAVESAAVVYAGDRMGPWRSALFWPLLASYLVNLAPGVVIAAAAAFGELSLLASLPFLAGGLFAVGLSPLANVPLLAGGGLAAVGLATLGVAAGLAMLSGHLVSPVATLAAYHMSRKPKRLDDNGTDLPRILPRGRGLPLPRFLRGLGQDDDDEQRDGERRTPVSARVTR